MISAFMMAMAAQASEAKPDWRAVAIADVNAAYRLFAENHPGMANPEDPAFPARLAAAHNASLKIAFETRDWDGYDRALDAFTDGLSDGHAFVVASDEPGKVWGKRAWPGFTAAWRGHSLYVHRAGPNSPAPVGSRILSCGGTEVEQLIRSRNRGLWFRPAEAGQWWNMGPSLLMGSIPPEPDQLKSCSFQLPDGRVQSASLRWERMPAVIFDTYRRAFAGEETPIGLSEPRTGVWLLGLSSFSPDEKGQAAYRKLHADIDRERAKLLKARAIVIDLRFNSGGSWLWGHDVARRLWGAKAVDERMNHFFRDVRIAWRASRDNITKLSAAIGKIRAGGHAKEADEVQTIVTGMEEALAAGQVSFIERPSFGDGRQQGDSPTDLDTPVYVITHGGCSSACLDAIDTFKRFENVKLIGAPTSADTTYMEAPRGALPSGFGVIAIPLKTWMHRPRKSGEGYQPDIPFNDLDWSTTAFLERIESDLQAVGPAPASR
ncbi:hypothetical protein G7076_09965 [Sphingomonas sp. HDW15A]|uniref:S41 family peptidase n=1 Tax=Sphingomonas sp. HDW15A TaxID=2714942 RepID=UPI001408F5CF|nr:S41 family peptidase [Sphingomonas sp. HDW15A]QIK96716.1 hypothetical protein G7076_09965 [Sphingomonas sp. HDW15A]